MSGARAGDRPGAKVDDRVGHRDEAARVEVLGDDLVGVDQQLARRHVMAAERQHQALELRHVERRGRALPGDVGDQDPEAMVVERQEVVVVAADFARRLAMP